VTDQLLRDTITTWPDRWHYPDLALELIRQGGQLDIGGAARSLLQGLAQPRSVTDALADLIDDGDFGSAEEVLVGLLDQESEEAQSSPAVPGEQRASAVGLPFSDDDWDEIEARLARARVRATADVAGRWAELQDRAAAVRLAVPDEPTVSGIVPKSQAEADQLLDQREKVIEAAERREREALERRLADSTATSGDADGASLQQWSSSVAAAIAAGEFSLADAILRAGPDDFPDAGPLTVPPPPFRWPWPDRTVTEVLDWYDNPELSPGPEFERYRPIAGDTAATQLRLAMLRLHERADGPAVRDFAVALTAILGESAAPRVDHVRPGGFLTRLFGLHDARLPRLPILRPEGVALWVAATDGGLPPPNVGSQPVIWFRPTLGASRAAHLNVAVLDVADLLRIIAPDGRRRHGGPPTRRINLLRLLLPQMHPGVILGEGAPDLGDGAPQRDSLAWLFDLIGLLPDRLVLDGLLYDSGAHPVVLRCLLDAMLEDPSALHEPSRLTLPDLRLVRQPEVRRRARSEVLRPLAADATAQMVLWLALWQFDSQDAIAPDQILEGFGYLDPPPNVMERFASDAPITRALTSLTGLRLLRPVADDRFALPPPGLVAVLQEGMAEQEMRAAAFAAMTALGDSIHRADEATAARLGERITRLIGHRVDNDVLSIGRLLTEAQAGAADPAQRALLDQLQDKVKGLGGGLYVRLYEEALVPPQPVEVLDLVRSVIGDVEWHVSKGVHLRRFGDEECWVMANPLVLREAIRNLVLNSVRALEKLSRLPRSGAIAITVRRHLSPPLPEGVRVAPPCVAIEVADDGGGFTSDDLAFYRFLVEDDGPRHIRRSADRPADHSSRRIGTGLLQTTAWLRDYGGYLQVLRRSETLGGASVTAWLPTLEDRIDNEMT